MELRERSLVLEEATKAFTAIYDGYVTKPSCDWQSFDADKTALIIVDVINGFAKEGALSSPRVASMIPEIVRMSAEANRLGIAQIALADEHQENSPEFASFPVHCLAGSSESQMVDELAALNHYQLMSKNSTNGFLEPDFQAWLQEHDQLESLILIGDCTDICVLQLGLTLKCWFNRQNKSIDLVVPMSAVETYDAGEHQGDLLNIMALYLLGNSGVQVVQRIAHL